jgi:hypothetical protein
VIPPHEVRVQLPGIDDGAEVQRDAGRGDEERVFLRAADPAVGSHLILEGNYPALGVPRAKQYEVAGVREAEQASEIGRGLFRLGQPRGEP